MAKAKTAPFYIRRTVDVNSSTAVTTLDTSAYVDPADRQGLQIESVDFVFFKSTNNLPFSSASDNEIGVQLLTGAYSELQAYDEEDLIASAGLVVDGAAGMYRVTDMYPDVLGTQDGRIVVDDQMSLIALSDVALSAVKCAVLIKCRVVTLTNKDYMALALQTVSN